MIPASRRERNDASTGRNATQPETRSCAKLENPAEKSCPIPPSFQQDVEGPIGPSPYSLQIKPNLEHEWMRGF
jgi:hypothetical protein